MNFLSGVQQVSGAQFDVLVLPDAEVVVGLEFGFAGAVGEAVFFGFQLCVAVGDDAVVAFMADVHGLVMLNVLLPVALGVDVNLLGVLAVLNAQFVEAVATGGAEGLEQRTVFIGRQLIGHRVLLVVQAAGNQRLVGVAFQEADQHFHAHAGNGDAAVTVAGPVASHTQPATGLTVGLAVAVPMLSVPKEVHLDAAIVVAVDIFARGTGDHRALAALQAR